MKSKLAGLLLLLATALGPAAQAASITPDGARLAALLDRMDVEHHWPSGQHVDWETGVPDDVSEKLPGRHTHCSAFVAAAAKRLDIYILRPPEHGQVLLANAQFNWLAGAAGRQGGWQPVADGLAAQALANRGVLVVAVYRNHHSSKPGHIAIVRPDERSERAIRFAGPQVIQAGDVNYASTTLKVGFADHPAAFERGEVRYYAHEIAWERVAAAPN